MKAGNCSFKINKPNQELVLGSIMTPCNHDGVVMIQTMHVTHQLWHQRIRNANFYKWEGDGRGFDIINETF